MGARENKQLLQSAFAELAQGNGKPFGDLMADDFCWQAIGTTAWSRPFRGKQAVIAEMMRPLFAQFADRYTNTAIRMIAEDDYVAVECRGRVMTKSGKPYNNQYCYVIRFADGKMRELMEYFDTELVTAALQAPGQ
jgi:ketosteroid isomerase-like protein